MDYLKIKELLDKFKIPLALSLVGMVLVIGGLFSQGFKPKESSFPKDSLINQKFILVDVSGAVVKPGVYKLAEGSRVEDAIALAGGLADKANVEYITKYINLAQKLTDGAKIYLPFAGESPPTSGGQTGVSGVAQAKINININNASQSELEALPGIGPVTAAKVISGRPYQKIEDLLSLKIVSKKVFEQIKDSVTVY